MCKSFLNPIGSRASVIVTSIPTALKDFTNAIAGAITCGSQIVPEKSKITAFNLLSWFAIKVLTCLAFYIF